MSPIARPRPLALVFACAFAAVAGCAKSHVNTDLGVADGGRARDLAGSDLLQIEEHDLGLCGSCDDQVACTLDVCLPTGKCEHYPDHGKCAERQLCTIGGCVAVDTTKLCATCAIDADCGLDELCTSLQGGDLGSQSYCLARCGGAAACPKGFACDTTRSRCVPDSDSGLCCFDGDADGRGLGAACLGTDCDDADAQVYAGKAETCDGKDNDCNGQKDDGYLCGGPSCSTLGTTGSFAGTAIPACTAGACETLTPASCGRYTCQAVTTPKAGNACRTSCTGTDDTACIAVAFCDGAACQAQLPSGAVCSRDRMCQSGHCQNGHCCASGDCCQVAADCPAGAYSSPPVCDAPPANCQGHREDRACTAQKNCAKVSVPDDSACGSSISINCNPAADPTCNGMAVQNPLVCATSCMNDMQCAGNAYCNGTTCAAKKPDGSSCGMDKECQAGRKCLNNFCCNATTGACCSVASDCPASFASPATCDAPLTSCQGHRIDKSCVTSICGSVSVDDDTACSPSISKGCGTYDPVNCTGLATQSPLSCPTSCSTNAECVEPQNHCLGGTCQPWVENGGACTAANQCRSGNCVGNVCCQSACNATTCDTCGGGACMPFVDPQEAGNACLPSLPDLGTGAFSATIQAYLQSSTDDEDWYQLYATDSSLNGCGGYLRVQLTVPAGVDYDVYLYSTPDGSCGGATLLGAGLQASGNEDVRWTESCSVSDEGWYLVRVRRYAGQSCTQPYTLTVDARL